MGQMNMGMGGKNMSGNFTESLVVPPDMRFGIDVQKVVFNSLYYYYNYY